MAPPATDFRYSWERLSEVLVRFGLQKTGSPPLCVVFEFDDRDALATYDKYVCLVKHMERYSRLITTHRLSAHPSVRIHVSQSSGLIMGDWKMQDWKRTDEVARVDIAGLDNDGLENDVG